MKKIIHSKKIVLALFVLFFTTFCVAQPPDYDPLNPSIRNRFNVRKTFDIRGDMLITGNNNLGNHINLPDNNTSIQNANINMVWVDIDGDPSTRNSSSANVTIPSCSKVIYAGLYWAATYRYESNNAASGRFTDWNTVKFKVPGGSYLTLTADDILYDGFGDTDLAIQSEIPHKPYSCYKDVTNLISPTNPNGDYFVGNIRVSKEGVNILNNQNQVVSFGFAGGACGGWSLVVVYEKLQLPSKKITTFDGHAIIKSGMPNPLNVAVSGFETLPYPEPVKARIGVMALDGDFRLKGDELRVKAGTATVFTPLQNPGEAVTNNFFNSSVTLNGIALNAPTDRNPNSINTLGWDSHLNRIPQNNNIATPPINPIIPNGATAATIQLTTNQDKYDVFFTSFDVEVIAPKIPLIKTITNLDGSTNIDGATLQLGQEFFYTLDLINIGNDNATSTIISDALPQNIVFPPVGSVILPNDVTYDGLPMSATPSTTVAYYTYNPVTKTFIFYIPNDDVKIGEKHYLIKIKARAPIDCNDLVNACSNVVVNRANISYFGDENTSTTPFGDASGNGLTSCETPNPGATNFLLNVEACSYSKTEVMCGTSLLLTAPSGYTSYIWTNSAGLQISTSQTVTVTAAGIYEVQLITNNPCKTISQTVTVVNFNNTLNTNPLTASVDEMIICPNNGIQLGKIYLCGADDFQNIQTGITGTTNIIWQKLISCTTPTTLPNVCPNTSTTCSWSNVGTGANFTASLAGQYRVIVTYQNGCFREYYFNVYKNLLNPTITPKDIVCTTPGSITISDIPSGYEYSLSSTGPFGTTNPIPVTTAGTYTVYIRQAGVVGACPFVFSNITILDKQMTVSIVKKNKICNNGFGNIQVQINGVNGQYTYQLSQGTTIIQNTGPINPNEYTFSNLNPGPYTVTCSTNQGCINVQTIEILGYNMTATAAVTQDINCNGGTIVVTPIGGLAPYTYAIYSYNGIVVNPADYQFQFNGPFTIPVGQQGLYQFIVFDSNVTCSTLTNTVNISAETTPTFTATPTNVTCNGLANGSIVVSSSNVPSGYSLEYSLDGSTYQSSNTFSPYPVGNYTIYIKVKNVLNVLNECIYQATATIAQPDPLVGTSHLVQQKTCLVYGSIEAINVSGGNPPYQYSINGGVGYQTNAPTNVFSNLGVGFYTILIKDAKGCTFTTAQIEITDAVSPTSLTFTNTNITCPSLTSTLTATVVGGTSPFVFQIIAPSTINATTTSGTNATFAGLPSGSYTVKVTDSKGCTRQETKTINSAAQITIDGSVLSNVSCFNTATGSANFTVSGFNVSPSATYSYTINAGTPIINQTATTISLTNLTAGIYKIIVTDNQTNCTDEKEITISGPIAALTLNSPFTPKTCIANGSLNASATGGWGAYIFTLTYPDGSSVVQNNGVFANLSQVGPYTIKVKDGNNCEDTATFNISNATAPTLIIDTVASDLCFDTTNGASITVIATGGTIPYQFQIDGGALQDSPIFNTVTPGNHSIKVTDKFGCEAIVNLNIAPQLLAQVAINKQLDCSATPDASLTINITGGTAPYQYQIKYNSGSWGTLTSVSTNPLVYTTAIAGDYQFLITDAAGCTFTTGDATILTVSNPQIASLTPVHNLCFGNTTGSITVNMTAGIGTTQFQYNLDGGAFQSYNYFGGLAAGSYTVTVKDANQCIDTDTILITQPNDIEFDLTKTDLLCSGVIGVGNIPGSITASNLLGGSQPYSYILRNITFQVIATYGPTTDLNHTFPNIDFGQYSVEIIDVNGCSKIKYITIASPPNAILTTIPNSNCATGATVLVEVSATIPGTNYLFGTLTMPNAPYATNFQPANLGTPTFSTFTGLTPGVPYTFIVKDTDTDCYYIQNVNTVIPPSSTVNTTFDYIQNVCSGSNGNVSFTMTNFDAATTSVSYEIFENITNTSTGFSGSSSVTGSQVSVSSLGSLPYGSYYILITENGGCTTTSPIFEIKEATNSLTLNVSSLNDNCNPLAGLITATAQFGASPYYYQITTATATPPTIATWGANSIVNTFNQDSGSFIVYVKDANNCIVSAPIIIGLDPSPKINLEIPTGNCVAEGQFSIKITRTVNGIAPYTYIVDNQAPFTESNTPFTRTNLSSGLHTVEIKDANGCGETKTITIIAPTIANYVINTQPSCLVGGTVTLSATNGSGNYSYTINTATPTTLTSTPAVFTNIPSGNYSVAVLDITTNCTTTVSFELATPLLVSFTTTSENPKCFGDSNGSITVNLATSTNTPYTYVLTAPSFTTITQVGNGLFTGLSANIYSLTVTSNIGCTDSKPVNLIQPSLLLLGTPTATAFGCNADNTIKTATITIPIPTTGISPYLYSINGTDFQTDNFFEIIDNGFDQNFVITVKDANGCIATTPIKILALPVFTLSAAQGVNHFSCSTAEDINIKITGGSGHFTYQELPSGSVIVVNSAIIPPTTPTIINTLQNQSGSFTYQITDTDTGCSKKVIYDIAPLQMFDIVATAGNSLKCFGDTNGTLTAIVNGYSGNFTYLIIREDGFIFTSGTNNPISITGLSAGNYTVKVTIPNTSSYVDCTKTSNVITISSPPIALALTIAQTSEVTCNPLVGGTITITNTIGGTPPYQYELLAIPAGNILSSYTNLSAGDYKVIVRDANLCEAFQLITLLAPAPITVINSPTITNQVLKCYNYSNASVTITGVSGGQGSYQYTLTNLTTGSVIGPIVDNTFSNLGVANYTIVVSDSWECSSAVIPFSITQPSLISATLATTVQATCAAMAQIKITATGGTPPYKYSNDNITYTSFSGTNTTFTVGPGTYQYYITDANNCRIFQTNEVTITHVTPIVLTLNENTVDINCAGQTTASIQANATFGLGGYLFSVLNATTLAVVRTPQNSGYFTNFGVGSYIVKVTGNGSCSALANFTVTEPTALLVSAPTIKNISCKGKKDGKITLIVSQGTLDYQFGASPNIAQTSDQNVFDNLGPGTYTFLIQDAKGCFQTITSQIIEPSELTALAPILTDELCEGTDNGTATITINGGTAPYKWSFNDDTPSSFVQLPNGVSSFTKTGLSGGQQYIFYVLDKNNCDVPITINTKPAIALNPSIAMAENCVNNIPTNSITVTMTPNYPNAVQYSINNGTNYQYNNVFSNLAPGEYKIKIKHTNGCTKETEIFHVNQLIQVQLTAAESGLNQVTATATNGQAPYTYVFNGENTGANNVYQYSASGVVNVTVIDAMGCEVSLKLNTIFYDLEIPNFFTPNGSGINDGWTPLKIDNLKNIKTSVFDRYGRELKILYNGDRWDGTYRGNEVPSGDYWYLVEVNDDSGRTFVGNFTLYR